MNQTLKIVLVGEGNVGKTSFVKKLLGNEIPLKYTPTLGVEVNPIRKNNKCYNIWDCAGLEKFGGLRDGYYVQAQGAIIMCDGINVVSINKMQKKRRELKRMGDFPIVYVLNKIDLMKEEEREELENKFKDVIFISCKDNINIDKVLENF
jgi:GTP-binding nuclear protein Ran